MRLNSYDNGSNRQVYGMLLCYPFVTKHTICCSVPIVLFSGRFWLPKTTETMAVIDSLIAAYYWDIAAEIKQFLLHKLQIQTATNGQFFGGQKITFSGSLWKLDFLSAYGRIMALFWQLFTAGFYAVSGSFTAIIISALYADCRVTSMI